MRDADLDLESKAALIQLQNIIVEPRYLASDWCDVQNFVDAGKASSLR